jgi:peptidoglycan/LPS O-acetylase OafA/YrhL
MAKKIFLFIILIRALAAIVITNAHYTGVYPTDLIANGGLLGDVLFFSVSGFCISGGVIS